LLLLLPPFRKTGGEAVNTAYIKKTLAKPQVIFKPKAGPRPQSGSSNSGEGVKKFRHQPFSPDIAPADFFLFRGVMSELAGLSLYKDSFKTSWEGPSEPSPKMSLEMPCGNCVGLWKA
jgi:hypothetical protein